MEKIKKVNKNYYKIIMRPFCSVFLDEYLMKKANKILYKYKNEIDSLLKNNPGALISESWSLAYPNGIQKTFHGTDLKPVEDARMPNFTTEKINNLYYIGDRNIYSKDVKKEIEKLMS